MNNTPPWPPTAALRASSSHVEPTHRRAARHLATPPQSVTVEVQGARVEVRGVLAWLVAYMVGTRDLADHLETTAAGQLWLSWGPGGPVRGKLETYYPPQSSSKLIEGSS